jgi:signal transduction histidine kinase/CheY-like chemotaxis protein
VLLRWQTPAEAAAVIAAVLRDGSWRGELTMLHRHGSTRTLQVHANIVTDESDQPIRIMANFIDITERTRAEEELRRSSEQLAQANLQLARSARLKDEFLANMSHELRTPLTSILGRSELLQEDVLGMLTEHQRRSVRSIEENGRHLLELINDILDLSKIEAGKMTLDKQPVRVVGLGQSCLRMIAETVLKKRLHIRTVFDENVTLIHADPRRLKQILVNLLANAVKFTPAGGEVGLEVRGNPANQTVDLIVWDTGIGIAPDDQRRLFQPFIQIDSSLARQYEGTGLGLVLVAQLAALHCGSVSLASVLGLGSRFTVTLPWEPTNPPDSIDAQPQAQEVHHAMPIMAAMAPLVLLVDDNAEVLLLLSEYLQLHGYRVDQAHTGSEALVRAQTEPPACIIMDIQLPEMNGLAVIPMLRTHSIETPILVLSAHAMPGDHEQALAAGANAYLSKPVRMMELLTTIAALIHAHTSGL